LAFAKGFLKDEGQGKRQKRKKEEKDHKKY
jgi:hypothetical protein